LHNIVIYVILAGGNCQFANVGLDACRKDFSARKNNVSEAQPECCAIALKVWVVAKALSYLTADVYMNTLGQDLTKELGSTGEGAWLIKFHTKG